MFQVVTTDRHGVPVKKPFFWSWSALNDFETCPKKYYHNKVAKDYPGQQTEEMTWGKTVHDALAARILRKKPLPLGMEQYEHWCTRVLGNYENVGGFLQVERQLALDANFQPCAYFDKKVEPWFRAVADVLHTFDTFAHIIDWKTNKTIKEDSAQLALSAVTVFAHFPKVEKVRTDFVWLPHDQKSTAFLHRTELPLIWQRMLPRVQAMQQARDQMNYPPNPSALCLRWCNVTSCPHHGQRP